jgi:GT2 family glycosyltransferase
MSTIDILIPTYQRPIALAVTLTSLVAQTYKDFRIVISDQTEDGNPLEDNDEIQTVLRLLRVQGHIVETHKHLPRQGIAEHRQFLLNQVTAPYALFMDNDLILETDVVERMLKAMLEEQCGFVGSAVIGLSFLDDVRPHEQVIEFWERVQPEVIYPDTAEWERWRLHNAANIYHVQQRLKLTPQNQRKYRVAWVGGCVLYDTEKIRSIGGFSFWEDLPSQHCGEDVLVQLRLMANYGGCGIIPSGVYHQELETTIVDRGVPADNLLDWTPDKQLVTQ